MLSGPSLIEVMSACRVCHWARAISARSTHQTLKRRSFSRPSGAGAGSLACTMLHSGQPAWKANPHAVA
jgi:hypothetical protein